MPITANFWGYNQVFIVSLQIHINKFPVGLDIQDFGKKFQAGDFCYIYSELNIHPAYSR